MQILRCRAQLENIDERFNVIIRDLIDPMEGGHCYQLYKKTFYGLVLKPRMRHIGFFPYMGITSQ